MKRLLLFALVGTCALVWLSASTPKRQLADEGGVIYKVIPVGVSGFAGKLAAKALPKGYEIYFRQGAALSRFKGFALMGEVDFLSLPAEGKLYKIKHKKEQVVQYAQATPEESDLTAENWANELDDDYEIIPTGQTDEIIGHTCAEFILRPKPGSPNEALGELHYWITNQIHPQNALGRTSSLLQLGSRGLPLRVEFETDAGTTVGVRYEATRLFETVPADISFALPSHYEVKNENDENPFSFVF